MVCKYEVVIPRYKRTAFPFVRSELQIVPGKYESTIRHRHVPDAGALGERLSTVCGC